ncbi:hypothetical protein ACI48J_13495 [Paenibacillus chitinolyticus]|uniref:hypothetical protein n=1 Tax=Paenibacillus chitinolyticus TaxID=79263 RepID=UPI003867F53F
MHKDLKLHTAAVQWLEQVLRQRNKSVSDIFYAVRGTQNQLYFDYYRDHIDKPID